MMKNSFVLILFLTLIISLIPSAVTAGAFDDVSLNARPAGMAEAYTAMRGGLDCAVYNPAGHADIDIAECVMSYRDFYGLGLINQKFAGFLFPDYRVNIGLSWHRVGTTGRVQFLEHDEDIYMLTVAGHPWMIDRLAAGVNFKFYRVFAESNASGYGFDAGLQYHLMDNTLGFGISGKNIGDIKIYWDTGAEDTLRSNYSFGTYFVPVKRATISLDYMTTGVTNFGMEVNLVERLLVLRGGISSSDERGIIPASGFSLNYGTLEFDYAFSRHKDLGMTHVFSLVVKIKRGVFR
ncbi:MAG: hypothetical protein ABIH89_01870 [Elusimicrobiota bacterium]